MKIIIVLVLWMNFLYASVDINNANIQELVTLNGVAAKKAKAIITYRKSHCFKSVDEITQVKGLGQKFLEKNRTNLRVGTCG